LQGNLIRFLINKMKLKFLLLSYILFLSSCNDNIVNVSPEQQTLAQTFMHGEFWVYSVIDTEKSSWQQNDIITIDTLVISNS